LPKAIREQLSIRTGDRIEFSVDDANHLLRHALDLYQAGKAHFNDYLMLATAQSQDATLETFDQKLKRSL
jgi:predicted nucleic-acid-binding protein